MQVAFCPISLAVVIQQLQSMECRAETLAPTESFLDFFLSLGYEETGSQGLQGSVNIDSIVNLHKMKTIAEVP